MTFLNATLLLGALAAAIPIALHLLGRKEPRRIPFPATRFLKQRLQSQRRTLQVKRWTLLAMRAALLLLIALALSQPQIHRDVLGRWLGIGVMGLLGLAIGALGLWAIITQQAGRWRWALTAASLLLLLAAGGMAVAVAATGPTPVQSETAPAAVAMLIDNSPTMAYQTDDGETRLEQATDMAAWVLSRYPATSRLAILDRSARPAAFALDANALQKRLTTMQPQQTTRPLGERLEAAVRLLLTSDLPRKTVFVFTDLSAHSWGAEDEAEVARLQTLLTSEPNVALHVIDVGSDRVRNDALQLPQLVDVTPAPDVPSSLTVKVRREVSTGETPGVRTAANDTNGDNGPSGSSDAANPAATGAARAVELRMFSNQTGLPAIRDGAVQLPPLQTRDRQIVSGDGTAVLTIPPLPIGTHHGVVELAQDDRLPLDDRRYFTVRVSPPRKILLVADNPDERRVLATMLNVFEAPDPRCEYEIDFATTATLADRTLANYRAVGLFNPTQPPTLVRDQLDRWVRDGGQLFVALGPALVDDWLNDTAGVVTTDKPRVEWPLVGNPKRIWRRPDPGTFMQVMQPGHPALSELSRTTGAPWSAFRIRHYWQLSDASNWNELTRYAGTEHVALGQRTLGTGRVMVMTTPMPALLPPANRWNDLGVLGISDAWPVYLILLQQIFEDLSGGTQAELNVITGEPVALPLEADAAAQWQLFPPVGPNVPLDRGDDALVPGTPQHAGNYWLRGADGSLLGFSANLAPEQTLLQRVTTEQLETLLGKDRFQLSRDRDEIQLAEGAASDGRPLYALAMLVVMAIFMLEQLLANRFYSGDSQASGRSSDRAGGRVTAA